MNHLKAKVKRSGFPSPRVQMRMCNKRPDRGRQGRVSCRLRRRKDDGHIYNPGFQETQGNFSQIRRCSLRWLPANHVAAPCSPQVLDLHTMQTWGRGRGVCVAVSTLSLSHPNLLSAIFSFCFLSTFVFFFSLLSLFHTPLTERFPYFHPCCVARIGFFNQILSHSKAHFNLCWMW